MFKQGDWVVIHRLDGTTVRVGQAGVPDYRGAVKIGSGHFIVTRTGRVRGTTSYRARAATGTEIAQEINRRQCEHVVSEIGGLVNDSLDLLYTIPNHLPTLKAIQDRAKLLHDTIKRFQPKPKATSL